MKVFFNMKTLEKKLDYNSFKKLSPKKSPKRAFIAQSIFYHYLRQKYYSKDKLQLTQYLAK